MQACSSSQRNLSAVLFSCNSNRSPLNGKIRGLAGVFANCTPEILPSMRWSPENYQSSGGAATWRT
jgi:hypothetical protein